MESRFEQQKNKINIINFDQLLPKSNNLQKRHGPLLPNTIRAIFSGPSNCGKTNVLLNLIINENGLNFENIYLFSKTIFQPKYQYLKQDIESIEGMKFYEFNDRTEVIDPSEALPRSIMIFDDVACEKQDCIKQYFSAGRHMGVDSFYLCQTYSRIPKQLIRDNCNFLVLFKQDEMNLKHVYNDHVNTDMTFEKFKTLCLKCWGEKHGFIVIDKDSELNNGQYRKCFDNFPKNSESVQ